MICKNLAHFLNFTIVPEEASCTNQFIDFLKLCKLQSLLCYYYQHYLAEKPERVNLLKKLTAIDASWRSIGNDLGLSYNDLQGLDDSNKSNQIRLDHVLEQWLNMDGQVTPATWKTIIDVVKGSLVQNKAHAIKIYQELKEESSK